MANPVSSEQELLAVETRKLEERGYTVYRGSSDLVPGLLRSFGPDAVAVGRDPKYVIEVIREGSGAEDRLKELRRQIAKLPGWELRVVLDRGARAPELREASAEQIDESIRSARKVFLSGETAAGLLLAWGIFEALSRKLVPGEFQRPQTPGRLIQKLTSEGYLSPGDERLLRKLAKVRNAVIHGELSEIADSADVGNFLNVIDALRKRLERSGGSESLAGR